MIYITSHGSITTESVSFRDDEYHPSYVHQIDSFFDRIDTGMRLPTQNMIDALIKKYPELKNIEGKTGLFVGSGASEWAGSSKAMSKSSPDYKTKIGFLGLINIQAGMVAKKLGISEYLATDATACISSAKIIQDATMMINVGIIDKALILGWDDQINSAVLEVFNELGASISKDRWEAGERDGFLIGAGIGFALLESHRVAKNPIAKLRSVSNVFVPGGNPLAVSKEGYLKSMSQALSWAECDIDLIKSHGTGTDSNNKAELGAIDELLPDIPVISYKSKIGHTMGASGVIELSMVLNEIAAGTVKGNKFMLNASGMGGVYHSSIFEYIQD